MITTQPIRADAEPLVRLFQADSFDARPKWIGPIRKSAMAWFAETGFPTLRHEEWRFTNIAPIMSLELRPLESPWRTLTLEDILPFTFGKHEGHRLVFVDGHYVPALSQVPEGLLEAGSLRDCLGREDGDIERHFGQHVAFDMSAFAALNTALFRDGAFVRVPARRRVEMPIHLLFIATSGEAGATAMPRNLIIAGKDSSATVIENYVSLTDKPYFTNTVTEVALEAGARLEHIKLQQENENAFHIATIQASQAADSHWMSHVVSSGGQIARSQIHAALDGQGAECLLNGLYMVRDEQLVDHHTAVEHLQPNCESHEFYHGILDSHSRAVFNGKIFVQQDAQKTNAKQTNRNLLLSSDATIDTKPQLEIYADDVKCTHGATVGQLDEDQLFYLQARGIGIEAARRMLIRAFASEVIARIPVEAVRERLDRQIEERFI